jgi:methionyl-tRNA formyltransferase
MKVGIISNSELSIPLLYFLKLNNVETVLYLGTSDAAVNTSSLILFCNAHNIPFEVEKNSSQLFEWLRVQQPGYSFVFGYRKLIDTSRLGAFKNRVFNIHPGKLPEYRGASPIFWQLKNGEEILGIAIHFLSDSYDAGAIVWSREVRNEAHFSHGLVEYIFSNLVTEGVSHILNTKTDELIQKNILQDDSLAVIYKKPTLADVSIKWETMHAGDIINLVKAVNPWNKGAITVYNNMEVKVIDAELAEIVTGKSPGTIVEINNGILVACPGNGSIRIQYMHVNGIPVPARFAGKFGFTTGQFFVSA